MNVRAAPLLLASLALVAGCAPSGPAAPPPAAKAVQDDPSRGGARRGSWVRAESEHKSLPIAWELRDDYVVPPGAPPQLVIVSQAREIPYVGQGESTQRAEFVAREQRLLDALAGHAELVAVLDWSQQHDWYFYADSSVTRESVAAILSDAVGRDIRVTVETDAGEFYKTLKQRTSGTPEKKP
jgi:hypothetical protein